MRSHSSHILALSAATLLLYGPCALAQRAGGGGGARPEVNSPNSSTDQNLPDVQKVDDSRFVKDAALNNLIEVSLGKLAIEKGTSDAVKQFGQKMIDDCTKAADVAKQLAEAGNVNVPAALDSKHQSRVDKLAKLSGAEFDKAYAKDQLKYHQQNLRKYQDEAEYGSVAQVKNFASKSLPTVQQHLALAKELNKSKK